LRIKNNLHWLALSRRWANKINRRQERQIELYITSLREHQMHQHLMCVRTWTQSISHLCSNSAIMSLIYKLYIVITKHTSKSFSTWIYASKSLWCPKVRDLENATVCINQYIVTLGKKDFNQICYLSAHTVCCWLVKSN
jgi:hypothetical protein